MYRFIYRSINVSINPSYIYIYIYICCIAAYIYIYKRKHSQHNIRTSMNTLLYKNIPLRLYSRKGCERVDVGYV